MADASYDGVDLALVARVLLDEWYDIYPKSFVISSGFSFFDTGFHADDGFQFKIQGPTRGDTAMVYTISGPLSSIKAVSVLGNE